MAPASAAVAATETLIQAGREGHELTRAAKPLKSVRASAPEGRSLRPRGVPRSVRREAYVEGCRQPRLLSLTCPYIPPTIPD